MATAVAAGGQHSAVLLEDGTVRTFGKGFVGQLGYGSTSNVGDTPASLPSAAGPVSLGGRAVAVAAGSTHTLVLLEDGTVRAFGEGAAGRLGYGATANVGDTMMRLPSAQGRVPVGGRALAVAAGTSHSLVVREGGALVSFGDGADGKLGYGSTDDVGDAPSSLPSSQSGVSLGGRAAAAAAGQHHSMVLLEDGSIRTFGRGLNGELGNGATASVGHTGSTLPSAKGVVPIGGRAVAIAAGDQHSLVLREDGLLFAFGMGADGRLGFGSTANYGGTPSKMPVPQGPVQLGGRGVALAAGGAFSLVLLDDGRVRAFGKGNSGQLGNGVSPGTGSTPETVPALVATVPLGQRAVALAAGSDHSVVLLEDGSVRTFGANTFGQLGHGSDGPIGASAAEAAVLATAEVPLASERAAGAVLQTYVPRREALPSRAVAVAAGSFHSLVLLQDGTVRTFGIGASGQLGYGASTAVGATATEAPALMPPVPLGGSAVAVAGGASFSLVLLADGTVRAFGTGNSGQLGYGDQETVGHQPTRLPSMLGPVPLGGLAVAVACGGSHSLVLLGDGTVRTFGTGSNGRLGYGDTQKVGAAEARVPSEMGPVPLGGDAVAVAGSDSHSLVLLQDGTVRSFGYGGNGRLGYGSSSDVGATLPTLPSAQGPVSVGGPVIAIAAGGSHSMLLLQDGTVKCFGAGSDGQLGYGSTLNFGGLPVTVPSLLDPVNLGGLAVAVAAGSQHSLVLLEDGTVRAFGNGVNGQLGYGSVDNVADVPGTIPAIKGPVPLGARTAALAAGQWHSLVLLEDGTVRSFGYGNNGRLGYGSSDAVGNTVIDWAIGPGSFHTLDPGSPLPSAEPVGFLSPALLTPGSPSLPAAVATLNATAYPAWAVDVSPFVRGTTFVASSLVNWPLRAADDSLCRFEMAEFPDTGSGMSPVCAFPLASSQEFEMLSRIETVQSNQSNGSAVFVLLPGGGTLDFELQIRGDFSWLVARSAIANDVALDSDSAVLRWSIVLQRWPGASPTAPSAWPCMIVNATDIRCLASPTGSGGPANSTISLLLSDSAETQAQFAIVTAFAPPSVDSPATLPVFPSVPMVGALLHVTGRHFGLGSMDVPVTVSTDAGPCAEPAVVSDLEITCKPPAGVGAAIRATVTVDGQHSEAQRVFGYVPPAVTAVWPTYILAGELVPKLVVNGTSLAVRRADVDELCVAGVCCGQVDVGVPGASLLCRDFQAPASWPANSSLTRARVGGQASHAELDLVRVLPVPEVDSVAAPAGSVAQPGHRVSIKGRHFGVVDGDLVAASFGSVVSTQCNQTLFGGPDTLECVIPAVGGDVEVRVLSRSGLWSALAGAPTLRLDAPVIDRVAFQLSDGGAWFSTVLASLPGGPPGSLWLSGNRLQSSNVTAIRLGTGVKCGSVTVMNDTAAVCEGFVDALGRDARPLAGGRLAVALQWPRPGRWLNVASFTVQSVPSIDAVSPPVVAPGGELFILGRGMLGPALDWLHVGGRPCARLTVVSESAARCTTDNSTGLSDLADRDGDALHVRLRLVTGLEAALLGAVRLSGSISVRWAEHSATSVSALPSSSGNMLRPYPAALALEIQGLGATECSLQAPLAGGGAALLGATRRLVDVASTYETFEDFGVAAGFGSVLNVTGSCMTAAGQSVVAPGAVVVRIPALAVSFTPETASWLRNVTSQGPYPLPALNATAVLSFAASGPAEQPVVAALLSCRASLEGPNGGPEVAATATAVNATATLLRFPPLAVSHLPLGGSAQLAAWCTWAPTGLRLALPSATITMAAASATLSAPDDVDPAGTDPSDGALLLLSGVTREVVLRVAAPLSARPQCTLSLSGQAVQALPVMLESSTSVQVPAGAAPFRLPVGASGSGGATVRATCELWLGQRLLQPAAGVSLRLAQLQTVVPLVDGAAPVPRLVLSSGASSFQAQPAPHAKLIAAQAPAWDLPLADGSVCVATVPSLPAGTSQAGTSTRFFAPAGAGGTATLSALALTAVGDYPSRDADVTFSVECQHPLAGAGTPASVRAVITGLSVEWANAGALPDTVAVAEAWPAFHVRVATSTPGAATPPQLPAAVVCAAAVPNASRVDGASAGGVAPAGAPAGSAAPVATVAFTSLSVTGRRGGSFSLGVTCRVGDMLLAPALHHQFVIRGCSPGQEPMASSSDLCQVCAANAYSDGGPAAACVSCPAVGARCVDGVLQLLQGFFRPPADQGKPLTGASELHPCFNDEACLLNTTARRANVAASAADQAGPQPAVTGLPAIRLFFARSQYLVALVIVLFLMYMPLVTLAITALDCHDRPIGGVSYLEADLSVECFSPSHMPAVVGSGALLLVVGMGFPLLLVATLRGSAERPSLRFLYDGYSEARHLRW
ncbi:hypothetical protein FNF31_03084 [Cafeteria roenbergensis]|uniref:Uncharacterized protein n=1 Tax=Cafeteria roenbergensis TaxID=33653 RepID=A0A5A8DF36_CAFRO|nr:hypothetical protein FNF31_03084 [Cafeteria roenbergensis]